MGRLVATGRVRDVLSLPDEFSEDLLEELPEDLLWLHLARMQSWRECGRVLAKSKDPRRLALSQLCAQCLPNH